MQLKSDQLTGVEEIKMKINSENKGVMLVISLPKILAKHPYSPLSNYE